MPQTPHVEKHFTASETVRDIVIGMSDGLTVPFALAAGLSGAVEATGPASSSRRDWPKSQPGRLRWASVVTWPHARTPNTSPLNGRGAS